MNYCAEPDKLWQMSAYELEELINAGRLKDRRTARTLETLAFNIGALVLSAVNAPAKFPKSPEEAFGRECGAYDGGKADMMMIAEQINRKLRSAQKEKK